jgi:hypothetical protein
VYGASAGKTKNDPEDPNGPPINSYMAESPWATNHGNPYRQDSSRYAGPTQPPTGEIEDFLLGRPGTTHVDFSSPYPDGSRVMWASTYGVVFKADPNGQRLAYIDKIESEPRQWLPDALAEQMADMSCVEVAAMLASLLPGSPPLREGEAGQGTSGIYVALDKTDTFYVPLRQRIVAYGDQIENDRFSPIEVKREYQIPESVLPREWDKIMGMAMTYDGMLAFATNYGLVGIVDREFTEAHYLQLGDGEEYIYNNVAVDEDGGIYVATHKAVYRLQWTGDELTIDEDEGGWRAEYGTGNPTPLPVQTLAGSGSTPTLMGVGDQDKFVVITDGEQLMNIVFLWRNDIPDDWEQLPGTDSRRIAAQVPVTFGDPDRERSFSDQSVIVSGYGAFVVNNEMQQYAPTMTENVMLGGEPGYQPFGCEKFEWDPVTRELQSVWVNQEVSLPNAVPTMSRATNLIYSIGARNGVWTLEAIDWDTGASAFYYEIGDRSRHNSAFATCEIGLDGSIYYGNFWGLIRIRPSMTQLPCEGTEPEEPPPAQGPTWTHDVSYGNESTTWTSQITGLETVAGVDTYVVPTSYDAAPMRRVYSAQIGGYANLELTSETSWLSRNELQPIKKEQLAKAMGVFDVTTVTNYIYDGPYGAPLSEGKAWTYQTEIVPSMGNPVTLTWNAEVVSVEQITVPAGAFSCYKVVHTMLGTPATRTEWWSTGGDLLAPVKVVNIGNYELPEIRDLSSYTPAQ